MNKDKDNKNVDKKIPADIKNKSEKNKIKQLKTKTKTKWFQKQKK